MRHDEVLDVYAEDYMNIDAVLFVQKVKKGPLHVVQHNSPPSPSFTQYSSLESALVRCVTFSMG